MFYFWSNKFIAYLLITLAFCCDHGVVTVSIWNSAIFVLSWNSERISQNKKWNNKITKMNWNTWNVKYKENLIKVKRDQNKKNHPLCCMKEILRKWYFDKSFWLLWTFIKFGLRKYVTVYKIMFRTKVFKRIWR